MNEHLSNVPVKPNWPGEPDFQNTDDDANTEEDSDAEIGGLENVSSRVPKALMETICDYLDARPSDFLSGEPAALITVGETLTRGALTPSGILDLLQSLSSPADTPCMKVTVSDRPVFGGAIAVNSEISISVEVPASIGDAGEALVFERLSSGAVKLVSTYDLMHGDLTTSGIFHVPRRVPGLTGKLHLQCKESVDILVLFIRAPNIRLWRHPIFQSTQISDDQFGRAKQLPPVNPISMRVLLRQILGLPRRQWALAQRMFSVLEVVEKQESYTKDTSQPLIETALAATTDQTCEPEIKWVKGPNMLPPTAVEHVELMSSHTDSVRRLAKSKVHYDVQSGGSTAVDKVLIKGMVGNDHEFRQRLKASSDLVIANSEITDVTKRAILNSALIGHHVFNLKYNTEAHYWDCIEDSSAKPGQQIAQRAKTYFDRLYKGQKNSFPKIDAALVAMSHGLPLELWEAESFEAFKEFVDLERQRRRGTESIKPLLKFGAFDYLEAIAQETIDLDIYDDIDRAAEAGVLAACLETGREPPEYPPSVRRMPMQAEPKVLAVKPNKPLWFHMTAPAGYEEGEALLFFASNERVTEGKTERPRLYLFSRHVGQNGDPAYKSVYESPVKPMSNCSLAPEDSGEVYVVFTRKGTFRDEVFFQRTRTTTGSFELQSNDVLDFQRAILRRGPEERQLFKRRLMAAPIAH